MQIAYSKEQLQVLKDKVFLMLQTYKPALQNVMRYWMFEYFVPEPIEIAAKWLILNSGKRESGTPYQISHKDNNGYPINISLEITKMDPKDNTIIIAQTWNNKPQIQQTCRIYCQGGLRHINYNDKTYRELPDSGNVYNHTMTQYNDIKLYNDINLRNETITEEEALILEVTNLFHDIPEMGDLEICNDKQKDTGKTVEEGEKEKVKARHIIVEQQHLTDTEKELLWNIYKTNDKKGTMFKHFEYLRYIIHDSKAIRSNTIYMHNYKRPIGQTIQFISDITAESTSPYGKIIKNSNIPSTKAYLKENKERIDFRIDYGETNCLAYMKPEIRSIFSKNKKLRNSIKKSL